MIWIIISIALLFGIWKYYVRPLSYWKNKGVRQSKPWLFLGDTWRLLYYKEGYCSKYLQWMYDMTRGGRNVSHFSEFVLATEKYFGFYECTKPSLCVTDPELIKQISVKDFEYFQDHSANSIDPKVDSLWGNTLISLKGEKWKHMRSTLSPSFTGSRMRIMYQLIVDVADNVVKYFLANNEDVVEVEMKDLLTRYTNDIIATTAFGISVNSLSEKTNSFYLSGRRIFEVSIFKTIEFLCIHSGPAFICRLFGFKFIHDDEGSFFTGAIKEAIKAREENNIVRPDMIHLMLESRKNKKNRDGVLGGTGPTNPDNGISDDEIASQSLVFFSAGFETVSQALTFGTYELAANKDVQDRLREEIVDTYNKHGNPTIEVLLEMNYMDMVLSEILRKWPPLLETDRLVTKPYTIEPVDKTEVPVRLEPNTAVWFPIYAIHRAPENYPDPDRFDPERFSPENKQNINQYTYMPFGNGPRFCIGARLAMTEIKSLLFQLLLNFEIVPIEKTKIPANIISTNFTNSFKDGNWLGLKRIKVKNQELP